MAGFLEASALPEIREDFSLHLKIGGDVDIGRGDAGVSEKIPNHSEVVPRLKERDGATVPKDVRRDAPATQMGNGFRCLTDVLLEEVSGTVARELAPAGIPEDESVVGALGKEGPDGSCGLWPERADALFAALAEDPDRTRAQKLQVANAEAECFGDAGAGVVQEEKQRMIARTCRSLLIGLSKEDPHLLRLEVRHDSGVSLLRRKSEDTLVLVSAREIVSQQMRDEASNRGEPIIARRHGIAARRFDVIEELEDCFLTDIVESKLIERAAGLLGNEKEEEAKSVLECANRMVAPRTRLRCSWK